MSLFIILTQLSALTPGLDFDLGRLAPAKTGCHGANAPADSEIVVCAKRRAADDVSIKTVPDGTLLPKAEFKLFGKVSGKVAGERGSLGPIPTNRMMVTLSMPF